MNKQLPAWAVLLIITLAAGLALGGTYSLTKDTIEEQAVAAAENARRAALPLADTFEQMPLEEGAAVDWCYVGKSGESIVGYVAQATTQGFGGPLEVIAGLDAQLALTGVSVGGSQFSETAGLGAKAKEPAFSAQFAGKQTPVQVIKAGGTKADNTIDAITSATITSSAATGAVNKIASFVEKILFPEGRAQEITMPELPEGASVFGASSKGYHGPVWVDAAFDANGAIIYLSVGNEKFAETEGVGAQVKEISFMHQFIGLTAPLEMSDIDAVSGATISSQAVVNAINKAYDKSIAGQ